MSLLTTVFEGFGEGEHRVLSEPAAREPDRRVGAAPEPAGGEPRVSRGEREGRAGAWLALAWMLGCLVCCSLMVCGGGGGTLVSVCATGEPSVSRTCHTRRILLGDCDDSIDASEPVFRFCSLCRTAGGGDGERFRVLLADSVEDGESIGHVYY